MVDDHIRRIQLFCAAALSSDNFEIQKLYNNFYLIIYFGVNLLKYKTPPCLTFSTVHFPKTATLSRSESKLSIRIGYTPSKLISCPSQEELVCSIFLVLSVTRRTRLQYIRGFECDKKNSINCVCERFVSRSALLHCSFGVWQEQQFYNFDCSFELLQWELGFSCLETQEFSFISVDLE